MNAARPPARASGVAHGVGVALARVGLVGAPLAAVGVRRQDDLDVRLQVRQRPPGCRTATCSTSKVAVVQPW